MIRLIEELLDVAINTVRDVRKELNELNVPFYRARIRQGHGFTDDVFKVDVVALGACKKNIKSSGLSIKASFEAPSEPLSLGKDFYLKIDEVDGSRTGNPNDCVLGIAVGKMSENPTLGDVIGCVVAPYNTHEIYWGWDDKAYKAEVNQGETSRDITHRARTLNRGDKKTLDYANVAFGAHHSWDWEIYNDFIKKLTKSGLEFFPRITGSSMIDNCRLAEGVQDVNIDIGAVVGGHKGGPMPYDIAGALPMLLYSGCHVTDLRGRSLNDIPLEANRESTYVAACSRELHDFVLSYLNR